jgi:hypothetical protein
MRGAPMTTSDKGLENRIHSAAAIKKICLDAGADDAGLVDLDRFHHYG